MNSANATGIDKERDLGNNSSEAIVSTEENGSPIKDAGYKKRGRPLRSGKAKGKGAANPDLGRQLRFLISKYHIKLLVLVETRTSGEKCLKLRRKIGFDSSFVEEAQGFSGGIWVLWKSEDVKVLARCGSRIDDLFAQWTTSLMSLDPLIDATMVKEVVAVWEQSSYVSFFELFQADGAHSRSGRGGGVGEAGN
ncbi:hypothetical protein K1719_027474 [Acacia pycnantha]|nr:hypothetical protein K1719_027474 [Acacia pycnantha]